MSTKDIGQRGEEIASLYLRGKGFRIVHRNWRTRWCEIDIIAKKDATVYFVEVKYRSNITHGEGFDYITAKKQQQMQFAAEVWTQTTGFEGDACLACIQVDAQNRVTFVEL